MSQFEGYRVDQAEARESRPEGHQTQAGAIRGQAGHGAQPSAAASRRPCPWRVDTGAAHDELGRDLPCVAPRGHVQWCPIDIVPGMDIGTALDKLAHDLPDVAPRRPAFVFG